MSLRGPREALRRWWLARLAPTERWTLTQRNVYIVPTRAGLAFGGTMLLLLLASINYQLNLGFALTFLLAGSAVASMHMTHASLRGLQMHLKPPAPVFAGERCQIDLVLDNPTGVRHGLGFAFDALGGATGASPFATTGGSAWTFAEVPPQTQTVLALGFQAPLRGMHALPLLRVESRFPFGLFRAWTVWRPAGALWVYPRLEVPAPGLPPAVPVAGTAQQRSVAAGGEFDGLRTYRRGDTPRQIAWKKVARGGELVSREGRESIQRELWLDWAEARLEAPEARLSRLSAWVVAAEAAGHVYGLRMPGAPSALAQGVGHRAQLLQTLAAWRMEPSQARSQRPRPMPGQATHPANPAALVSASTPARRGTGPA